MRSALKAAVATTLVVGALVLGAMLLVSPSDATTGRSCSDLEIGPGWGPTVDVAHNPATVTVDAPAGYLIDAYCVKSGGGPQAAVVVTVSPAAATVVIDHPTRPTVREYALHLVPISTASGGSSTPPGTGGPSIPAGSGGPSGTAGP